MVEYNYLTYFSVIFGAPNEVIVRYYPFLPF